MMKVFTTAAIGLALSFAAVAFSPQGFAQEGGLQSLRGATALDEGNDVPEILRQDTGRRFEKAYRQQPPLIPHKIEKYQINLKVNQCMRCHDWPYNARENAPKISETHYKNRDGVALDKVARTRWFCTQCHVPQSDASALISNTFKPASGRR